MKTAIEPTPQKTKIASRKPSLALHKKPPRKPTDIDRMRSAARRLLKKLESEIKRKLPDEDAQITVREKQHHLLFGARSTYLSALTSLADLLFKLEQGNAKSAPAESAPPADIPMTPADVALVEHFVNRIRTQPEV